MHGEGRDYVKDIIEQMGYSRTGKKMEDVLNETSDPAVGARRLLQYLASKYEKEFINEGAERGLTHKTFDNISQAASELSK